jgi:V/A-type H+-transporting ATPase subunit K
MNTVWTAFAAAGVMALAALATAWAQSRIGAAISASLAEIPELTATAVILVAIPETMVILGFVVAVLIILRSGGAG